MVEDLGVQRGADTDRAITIVLVTYDGIQGLDLVGPVEVFHGATQVLEGSADHRPRYRTHLVAAGRTSVTTESGLRIGTLDATAGLEGFEFDEIHTLVIPGGLGAQEAAHDPELIALVRTLAARAERIATVCSGAFVAAAAGLLDGHRVATHWARARALREQYANVEVDPEPIFIHDGRVWSSAGVTAGIDLALALVEHDIDAATAQVVARWLVMFLRRPGGQTQFSTALWTERAELAPIRRAQDLVDHDPGADHRVGRLAERVGMSERNFTRRFAEEVGMSPARYVAAVRLEAARRELEASTRTVEAIARRCGFGTSETMRRTFARRIGVSPDQYRRRFHAPTRSDSADQASGPDSAERPDENRLDERKHR